jgi:aminoglycoside phosphotransferase family enzyme/predicted kinase
VVPRADALEAMRHPNFYPHRPDSIEVVETHISTVFLAGDRAYKVKKELSLPFLDYSTLERRRHFCHEEVRLNRRLASDTYLGVDAITKRDGRFALDADVPSAVEYAVEMRRLPEERTLDRLVESGEATEAVVERVARRIAQFHGEAERGTRGYGGPAEVKKRMDENFQAVLPWLGTAVDRHSFTAGEGFCDAFLVAKQALLTARVERGRVREGHGDLRAGHVVLEGDRITIYDCVEFDERLRFVDVASDLAFLYMDLERLGAGYLATALADAYVEESGDTGVRELLPFFACYRAWVRAKTACLRLEQLGEGDRRRRDLLAEAASFAALAHRLAWRGRLPLVLVFCGVAASGKSALAEELSARSGLAHLGTDLIRKGLAGIRPDQRGTSELYQPAFTVRTYEELARRAVAAVEASGGAIVDGTFAESPQRRLLLDSLEHTGARVLFCECRAPVGALRERAVAREEAPQRGSDATWSVVESQLERFEPLDDVPAQAHLPIRTDRPPTDVLDEIEAAVNVRTLQYPTSANWPLTQEASEA